MSARQEDVHSSESRTESQRNTLIDISDEEDKDISYL